MANGASHQQIAHWMGLQDPVSISRYRRVLAALVEVICGQLCRRSLCAANIPIVSSEWRLWIESTIGRSGRLAVPEVDLSHK